MPMFRELFISIYLFVFKLIFNFFNLIPLQNKTVFIVSFKNNLDTTINLLDELIDNHNIIILDSNNVFQKSSNYTVLNFKPHNIIDFLTSIYHLATARHIIIDNYYAFLSVTNFKTEVKCTQLWHAVGAMKLFGLNDMSNGSRSEKAIKRFKAVYDRFDSVVVGSRKMEQIFKASFGIEDETRFLRTGIPRTDFFFNDVAKQKAMQQFKDDFPLAADRKVILYAPTYREDQLNDTSISLQMNLDKMYKQLKSNYILLLRLHPALNNHFINKYPGFVFNVSEYESINTLLVGSDILITDYSSIPFEFALLNKPMIFYTYDLDTYGATRGLPDNYMESVPGPIAYDTDDIIQLIKQEQFDLEKVKHFANEWNEYSQGNSTQNLIESLYAIPKETEQIREHV